VREGAKVTKQTWTATVSAVLFVVLAAVIALVPVPYITWSPGSTHNLLAPDQNVITVTGAKTYPTNGQLLMTTVAMTSPDSTLSLPELLFSYWLPSREVLPRSVVYGVGEDPTDINRDETQMMTDSQSEAVVAALRESGVPVTSWPMVQSVTNSGPSNDILEPGDLIQYVDGRPTTSVQDVQDAVSAHHVGEAVVFTVMRGTEVLRVTVTTRATAANPDKPIVGLTLTTGYTYKPKVAFAIDQAVGGSSAGLMFALAITDQLTETDQTAGRKIAGTGTMAADGNVGPIGGVQEKIAAAARDGATIFLLPVQNCVDAGKAPAGIRLVPVKTLNGAIQALAALEEPETASTVAGCP
jgi:Lon-like protease